jgi:peptidoglycan hydrolase CwlO-like protein
VPQRRFAQVAGLALGASLALILCLVVPGQASAAPSISQARSHAAQLQAEIAALNGRMAAVAARYDATAQHLNAVDARIADNQRRLTAARYQLAVARRVLAERVVAMYKAPASGFLDAALTSRNFDDLVNRVHLWNDVYEQGTIAVAALKRTKAAVELRGRRLAGDRKQAVGLLAQVGVERSEIAGEVRSGQSLLAAAQSRVKSLVRQAKARRAAAARAAKAAAAAARAAGYHPVSGAGGAYSPLSWARALLGYLGMPVSSQNLTAITSWELAEGGHWFNSARYNPLDTTMPEPGATVMNSVGVKAYTSWAEGFTATIATLRNGLYGPILAALRSGDDAVAVAAAVASSPWGTGAFGV